MHPTKLSKQELEKLQAALEQLVADATLDATHALVRNHRLPKQALAALLKMTTSAAESHLQTFFLASPAPHPSAADRLLVQQAMGSASIFCDKAQIEHWLKKATARFFAILERTCAALSGKAGGSDQRLNARALLEGLTGVGSTFAAVRYTISGEFKVDNATALATLRAARGDAANWRTKQLDRLALQPAKWSDVDHALLDAVHEQVSAMSGPVAVRYDSVAMQGIKRRLEDNYDLPARGISDPRLQSRLAIAAKTARIMNVDATRAPGFPTRALSKKQRKRMRHRHRAEDKRSEELGYRVDFVDMKTGKPLM